MDNIILTTIFICLFIIVIGVFIYMIYDYIAFEKDLNKDMSDEEKLIKLVQKNYEYYHELNNTISNAVNENSELIVTLETSNPQIKKKMQDIEINRTKTMTSFGNTVAKYQENIAILNNNNQELNKSIRLAKVCATAKKVKKQNTDMTTILYLLKQQTNRIWDILMNVDKKNQSIDYRVQLADYKIRQHDVVIQNLKDNNVIIQEKIDEFNDHIQSQKQFLEDVINTMSMQSETLDDMNSTTDVNLNNIDVLNTSNVSDKNNIIYLNNEMKFVNNTLVELENRTSNLEYQLSTQEWENINLQQLNQRANNLQGTIQNHFDKVEELSTVQSGFVNDINTYKSRMNTNENNTLSLEEQSINTSNDLLNHNNNLNTLNNQIVNLREKAELIEEEVQELESDWENTSNQVITNIGNQTNINNHIFDLDNAMKKYFNFSDNNDTNNLYKVAYDDNTSDVDIVASLEGKSGLTVETSASTKNSENFKICDDADNCMHLSIKDDKFYLTPDSIGKFSIISEYSPLIDFDLNKNVISLGKFQSGINNGLGRPMVIKDGYVHMDEFYVDKCTP